jgi:ABC-type amino acid transport substrate-binding protein
VIGRQGRFGVAVFVAGLSALSSTPSARADLAEIQRAGVLRVLVAADELPHMFSFDAKGDPGLEREMIEAFARARALRLQIIQVERFETIIPDLLEGRGDLVTGIINTPARRQKIAFTIDTLPARHLAVTRAPTTRIDGLDDLRKRRVGTVIGSSWTDAALEAGVPAHNLIQVNTAQLLLQDLAKGVVEAVVMSVTDFAQAQKADGALQAGVFVGAPAHAAWGVRKEDKELKRALDDFLKALLGSPTWSQMVLRYFTQDALALIAQGRK